MVDDKFIDKWLVGSQPNPAAANLWIYNEQANTRLKTLPAVCDAVKEHLIGLNIIEKIGGYKKAAIVIKNRLPTGKQIRSGDLGEILASEYVEQKTTYRIPLRRLRYKDDRQMAMRGDDVIAIRLGKNKVTQVLKVEAKSRASLATNTVVEAIDSLLKNSSRPNPNTLAFISVRLRELNRSKDAQLIERLQQNDVRDRDVEHLVFTFSGNNPAAILENHIDSPKKDIQRFLVGIVIPDHQSFIKKVFESIK